MLNVKAAGMATLKLFGVLTLIIAFFSGISALAEWVGRGWGYNAGLLVMVSPLLCLAWWVLYNMEKPFNV